MLACIRLMHSRSALTIITGNEGIQRKRKEAEQPELRATAYRSVYHAPEAPPFFPLSGLPGSSPPINGAHIMAARLQSKVDHRQCQDRPNKYLRANTGSERFIKSF